MLMWTEDACRSQTPNPDPESLIRIEEALHGFRRTVSGPGIREVPGDVALLLARVAGYESLLVRSSRARISHREKKSEQTFQKWPFQKWIFRFLSKANIKNPDVEPF